MTLVKVEHTKTLPVVVFVRNVHMQRIQIFLIGQLVVCHVLPIVNVLKFCMILSCVTILAHVVANLGLMVTLAEDSHVRPVLRIPEVSADSVLVWNYTSVCPITGIMAKLNPWSLLVQSIRALIVLTRRSHLPRRLRATIKNTVYATLATLDPTEVLVLTLPHLAVREPRAQSAVRARHALQEHTKTQPAVSRAPTVQRERTKTPQAVRRAWPVRPVTPLSLPARGSASHVLSVPTAWMAFPVFATRGMQTKACVRRASLEPTKTAPGISRVSTAQQQHTPLRQLQQLACHARFIPARHAADVIYQVARVTLDTPVETSSGRSRLLPALDSSRLYLVNHRFRPWQIAPMQVSGHCRRIMLLEGRTARDMSASTALCRSTSTPGHVPSISLPTGDSRSFW